MQKLQIILLLLFASSCKENMLDFVSHNKKEETQKKNILLSSKDIFIEDEVVYLKSKKYSGFIYELFANKKDSALVAAYNNGLLNGMVKKWYPNNQVMEERNYSSGKKNGKQVSYWENGNKKFEFIANKDAYEGTLQEWASDGKLIHLANYVNGQEEGTQKLWYDNGKVRANYVMKNGKRYGLLGTKNCKNVSNSISMAQ
jgi:antitoxin component YwqK of YwqJK toxin-antitoxin module